ncbi:MAG: glycosyltransferase family 4 protein [bacterium]
MKKVLLLTLDFPPQTGGVANYLANISQNLSADKISILTVRQSGSAKFDQKQGYKIYRENLISQLPIWPKWLAAIYHAFQVIKKEKPDLILVGQILPLGTVALVIKKLTGLNYFVSCHGMDILLAQKNKRKKWLTTLIIKNSQQIIANSQFTKKEIMKLGAGENKITVIYPCPHTNIIGVGACPNITNNQQLNNKQLNEKFNLSNKKVLLTVGRLVERKGQDQVIRALPEVIKSFPKLVYFIVGSGPYQGELEKLAKELNLEDKIIFAGRVNDEELTNYYQTADIFIMASRQIAGDVEGFGIVYLEAASFGLPVIAGRSGGVGEAVLDGQTGILVNPENIKEIAQAIIKLLADENLAKKMGQTGKERVEKEFQWSKQAAKLKELLK